MRVNLRPARWSLIALVLLLLAAGSQEASAQTCTAQSRWVTNPSLPDLDSDPPKGQSPHFCGFYQYAWQAFLYLTHPAEGKNGALNFEVLPSVDDIASGATSGQVKTIPGATVFVDKRTNRTRVFRVRGIKPFANEQAQTTDVLVDQEGHQTYYEQFLNRTAYDLIKNCRLTIKACAQASVASNLRFPAGSIEIKVSWRVLTNKTPYADTYYRLKGVTVGTKPKDKPVDLGLVGFHLVYATPGHEEMVWATFEHVDNAPSGPCPTTGSNQGYITEKPPDGFSGWAFNNATRTSKTSCIASAVNQPTAVPTPILATTVLTPTQAFRNYAYGTGPSLTNAAANIKTIVELNGSVRKILTEKSSVWRYYFLVGGVWTGGALPAIPPVPTPASAPGKQGEIGSTLLADATMETFLQAPADLSTVTSTISPTTNKINCFSCHNTNIIAPNTTQPPPVGVSHVVAGTVTGTCPYTKLPDACEKAAHPVRAHSPRP
jgi:hypothetical protein